MTLDEFMQTLIKPNPEAEDSYDYEALAFDAGVEYAINKIKKFLGSETKEQKISLPEYLEILGALSDHRSDEDFNDRDIGWEESGYRSALYDVRRYLQNSTTDIERILEEYKELGLDEDYI